MLSLFWMLVPLTLGNELKILLNFFLLVTHIMYAFAGVKPKIVLSDSITPMLLVFNTTFWRKSTTSNIKCINLQRRRRGHIMYKELFSSMNERICWMSFEVIFGWFTYIQKAWANSSFVRVRMLILPHKLK